MFTQAHISLARFLANEMQIEEVKNHRFSLSFGSILPDRSPKQRMKDHEFDQTWEDTKERIRILEAMTVTDVRDERAVCRQLGMVLHYLADYFTRPHNPSYRDNMIVHSFYEGREAMALYRYLRSPEANAKFRSRKHVARKILDDEQLFAYIEKLHKEYLLEETHTPRDDIHWIVNVCSVTAVVLMKKVYGDAFRCAR